MKSSMRFAKGRKKLSTLDPRLLAILNFMILSLLWLPSASGEGERTTARTPNPGILDLLRNAGEGETNLALQLLSPNPKSLNPSLIGIMMLRACF